MDNLQGQRLRQGSKVTVKAIRCFCHDPEECSSQDVPFKRAWKAIEDGTVSTLEQAIQEMKQKSSAPLNVCRITSGNGVIYSMTLLALCGFHGRKDMVDLLLEEGADMNSNCACSRHGPGVPVSQMMLHGLIQHSYDKLEVTMLEYFIQKGATPSGMIGTGYMGLGSVHRQRVLYDILDLPLAMSRIDCAKVLVEAGVDPVSGSSPEGEKFDVVPLFEEYFHYGTNEFIRWVFNVYIPQHPEVNLMQRIIRSIINMKEKDKKTCWWQSQRRASAHAVLTSHHCKTIEGVVRSGKEEHGLDLFAERSSTGKTALHIAAENNDEESVHILLQLGADTRAYDNSDMNPFMLAVEKGLTHLKVAKAMMKKDPGLLSLQMGSGLTVIQWALEKGHRNAFFKGCFEEDPKALLTVVDSQGNRIAHLAAASGNTEVFKILWSMEFTNSLFSHQNSEGKTPLQLAVEKQHINILWTLQECLDGGRVCTTPGWHRKLRKEWWKKMIPYFLYAASCGTLSMVKYFVASGYKPNISLKGKTPLLCAAEAGHDQIVVYLLQFREVCTDLKEQPQSVDSANESPLLVAAQNGHTKCVTHLLQKEASVHQSDPDDRNCLMFAIQNHHADTALAILSEKDGLEALKRDRNPTPLQLLIKEMPDLAEFVLSKCIKQEEPERKIVITGENFSNYPVSEGDQSVHYDFSYLDNTSLKDSQISDSNILNCMVQHNRLKLLQHPLVENYLFQKFWLMTFPLFLLHLLFYCTFLGALTCFVLVSPRPGPDDDICPGSTDGDFSGSTSECPGLSGGKRRILGATAILLYFLSFSGLLLKVLQRNQKYFRDWDEFFQLVSYALTIIFMSGYGNECWCATTWQWQIGAITVFLSWLNFILVLRCMPHTAVPINMFLSICVTFLKLIFLPIVLVLAFSIPFYMIFVRTPGSFEAQGTLVAFRSPAQAIAKTVLQLVGEFDFEKTFNEGVLLYSPTTYILFFTFLVTMPVLFTNFLTGLAVGDTQKEKEKAEFTKLQVWVKFILEQESGHSYLRILRRSCKTVYSPSDEWLSHPSEYWSGYRGIHSVLTLIEKKCSPEICIKSVLKLLGKEYTRHVKIVKDLKERNVSIYSMVMEHNPVDAVREDVTELKENFKNIKQEMASFKKEIAILQTGMRAAVKDESEKLDETIKTLMQTLTAKVEAIASRL